MELANGYWELTDAQEQRARFAADLAKRAEEQLPIYPSDEKLLHALEHGLPNTAGVARGVDRFSRARWGVVTSAEVWGSDLVVRGWAAPGSWPRGGLTLLFLPPGS